MSTDVDESVATLVRACIPKLMNMEWHVEFVDRLEDADADLDTSGATVRIHRSWLHTVYEPALYRVARHYPLALEAIAVHNLPISLGHIELWRGIAIEREYVRGLFTRRLLVDESATYTYIARTSDRLGAAADSNIVLAVRNALSERRLKLKAPREDEKRLAEFREQVRERLLARAAHAASNDKAHRASLRQFRTLLPDNILAALARSNDADDRVSLIELEQYSADAVKNLSARNIRSLIQKLDSALDEAQSLAEHSSFTDDELLALRRLAQF